MECPEPGDTPTPALLGKTWEVEHCLQNILPLNVHGAWQVSASASKGTEAKETRMGSPKSGEAGEAAGSPKRNLEMKSYRLLSARQHQRRNAYVKARSMVLVDSPGLFAGHCALHLGPRVGGIPGLPGNGQSQTALMLL